MNSVSPDFFSNVIVQQTSNNGKKYANMIKGYCGMFLQRVCFRLLRKQSGNMDIAADVHDSLAKID